MTAIIGDKLLRRVVAQMEADLLVIRGEMDSPGHRTPEPPTLTALRELIDDEHKMRVGTCTVSGPREDVLHIARLLEPVKPGRQLSNDDLDRAVLGIRTQSAGAAREYLQALIYGTEL